jgi:hypothetical protein
VVVVQCSQGPVLSTSAFADTCSANAYTNDSYAEKAGPAQAWQGTRLLLGGCCRLAGAVCGCNAAGWHSTQPAPSAPEEAPLRIAVLVQQQVELAGALRAGGGQVQASAHAAREAHKRQPTGPAWLTTERRPPASIQSGGKQHPAGGAAPCLIHLGPALLHDHAAVEAWHMQVVGGVGAHRPDLQRALRKQHPHLGCCMCEGGWGGHAAAAES